MQTTKSFSVKRLCIQILGLLFSFQIPRHGSSAPLKSRSISFNNSKLIHGSDPRFITSVKFSNSKVGTNIKFAEPPVPSYPKGNGFPGDIDIGGLKLSLAQYFSKVWSVYQGGYDDFGTSFYEPVMLPPGYLLLGHFSQPNAKPIPPTILVAQDTSDNPNNPALAKPMAYALMWSSVGVSVEKDGEGYIWLPIPPNGYLPVGQIVTKSPDMPSVDIVRVVRQDLTAALEYDQWVWGKDHFNIHTTRPVDKGGNSLSVPVGTFLAIDGPAPSLALACLKRARPDNSSMPNIPQVQAMLQAYSPVIFFHPNEEYLPSSVEWLFENGALVYRTAELNGAPIRPHGWNLPIKGTVDNYYIDLPSDPTARERVKKGDLQNAKAYVRVKPAFGATYTDLAIWLFYPFNGPGQLQLGPATIKFKSWGEHVGDWEHLTLRVENFNGGLKSIYLSQHDKGTWVNAMEFDYGPNGRPIVYSALHGHAHYSTPGHQFLHAKKLSIPLLPFMEKDFRFGVGDNTDKSDKVMDVQTRYEILQSDPNTLLKQQWLFYPGRWGPKITYKTEEDIDSATGFLPGKVKDEVRKLLKSLPNEIFGEEGPQGPMMKDSWAGEERI